MDLRAIVKNAYHKDTICAKIIVQPEAYPRFGIQEGLIWAKNQLKCDVICIPQDTFQRGRRLIEIIINHVHQTIGQWKTSNYIQWSYWWPQMATDIEAFCRLCGNCQTNKTNTQKPQGFLHSLSIPDKPWQLVGMDFMGPLPQSQGNDSMLVIIDRLTSQVHLVVGCIYAPDKVSPNIFQFHFDFSDIFHHTSMHPLLRNFYEFYLIFNNFISPFIVYQNYLYSRQHFLFDSVWCRIC